MPYFVSSIIAVTSAMIILFTRYEADDSAITSELERMKSMFVAVDGFVNTYIQSGGDLTKINFQKLSCDRILLGSIKDNYYEAENCDDDPDNDVPNIDNPDDDVLGVGMTSTLKFPSSSVIWHLIPNQSNPSSYKLLVDMRANSTLMSKAIFSESFSSREFCEKILFGTKVLNGISYDSGTKDFGIGGTTSDGLFVCEVFK